MTPSNLATAFTRGVRPALYTALWTFLAAFGLGLIGWLETLQQWASGGAEFPDLSVLRSAFVGGLMAALTGFTAFLIRSIQAATGTGSPPTYGAG